jgi:hypothetical protein
MTPNRSVFADPTKIALWHAAPHKWGPGAIHFLGEDRTKTLCGKLLADCPGAFHFGTSKQINCKVCRKSLQAAEERKIQQERWEREAREREALRAQQSRTWWAAYDQYLDSPTWAEKRRLVLKRCSSVCEGYGERKAVQVHHLQYPGGCLPGTEEWIKSEKLFHLVALCVSCHRDLHPLRDESHFSAYHPLF